MVKQLFRTRVERNISHDEKKYYVKLDCGRDAHEIQFIGLKYQSLQLVVAEDQMYMIIGTIYCGGTDSCGNLHGKHVYSFAKYIEWNADENFRKLHSNTEQKKKGFGKCQMGGRYDVRSHEHNNTN